MLLQLSLLHILLIILLLPPPSSSVSVVKPGCPEWCGKLKIPYPFGVGLGCSMEPSFDIICNTSTDPPKAYLSLINNTEVIEITDEEVRVKFPNLVVSSYGSGGNISTTSYNLSQTQYMFSEHNWLTAIGCDDMVAVTGQANRSFGGGCVTYCLSGNDSENDVASCPDDTNGYGLGDGCCRSPIPLGTTMLSVYLSDVHKNWRGSKLFSSSYAFIGEKNSTKYSYFLSDLDNATIFRSDNWVDKNTPPVRLDWRVRAETCDQARKNLTTYACQLNTKCIDYENNIGGYLCNCSEGYEGNPYLAPGCQDINECANSSRCHPKAKCVNTQGSFYCKCQKGYSGSGKGLNNDNNGCYKPPPYNVIYPLAAQPVTSHRCHPKAKCVNTQGSFYCKCQKGYSGKGLNNDNNGCYKPPPYNVIYPLAGIGAGLGLILVVLTIFSKLRKLLQKRNKSKNKEKCFERLLSQHQVNEGSLERTKLFHAKELEKATNRFNKDRIIGEGGQGTVYKGMLSDGKIVAIKKLKFVGEDQLEQLINEVVILSQVNHRNVVKLLGCCLETETPLLVYEFVPNGTLFDVIHDPKVEFPFPWNMRLKIAADIAGALAYLHSASSIPIYHRDIKSSNILLDEKFVVKVSDFGTSKVVAEDQTHLTTMVKGTFGYLDPEYFYTSQFTDKSDVYSFGVVLAELLTGRRPISLNRTVDDANLSALLLESMEANNLDAILDAEVSEQGGKEEVIAFARLAERCLNLKGMMRPTMREVAAELESIRISQMPSTSTVNDESQESRVYEARSFRIADNEYRWSDNYKSEILSQSPDTSPFMSAVF